jgi:hypothetical protein
MGWDQVPLDGEVGEPQRVEARRRFVVHPQGQDQRIGHLPRCAANTHRHLIHSGLPAD